MIFCIVGTGHTPIPPIAYGAVESLIWDYYQTLTTLGHQVYIINKPNTQEMINEINSINPDIVHIQYDDNVKMSLEINCKTILFTSHFAYIAQYERLKNTTYFNIFQQAIECKDKIYIFALTNQMKEMYVKFGFPAKKIHVIPNGVNDQLFQYEQNCKLNKSIYIAVIDLRKSQYKYQSIDNIDFVGNYKETSFDICNSNYIGEWSKSTLYNNLTNYANLVLLSDGEGDPLVVKEALICGLGIVISEYAIGHLDISMPFISVIYKDKLDDIEHVKKVIEDNRNESIRIREQIRNYGKTYAWSLIINDYYLCKINQIGF